MPLAAGTRLGPYEILAPLGAGGMGEVYRARDTQAQPRRRDQGPAGGVRADPERLARFEREAQLLASLNHPNIAAIYGLEEADGRRVRSCSSWSRAKTLARADRSAGRSPSTKRCAIAQQIADAPRGRAREGHRPSRPEARQHQGHARTARSRCSTSAWRRRSTARAPRRPSDPPTRRR